MSDDNLWTVTHWTLMGLVVVAAALHLLTWRIRPIAVARDILRLEQRIAEVEEIVSQPSPAAKAIASRLKQLEHRVMYPSFARHADGCRQCRGDEPSEEGGPSPLCERGFVLMQKDVSEANKQEGER